MKAALIFVIALAGCGSTSEITEKLHPPGDQSAHSYANHSCIMFCRVGGAVDAASTNSDHRESSVSNTGVERVKQEPAEKAMGTPPPPRGQRGQSNSAKAGSAQKPTTSSTTVQEVTK